VAWGMLLLNAGRQAKADETMAAGQVQSHKSLR